MDEIPRKVWEVKFIETIRGDKPVDEFIKSQDEATHAKILSAITLLRNSGPFLNPPYAKKLQNKLYELRISGKNAIRIFYTLHSDGSYYLLHAFKKKSQKTPPREIKTALDRIKELI